MKQAVYFSILFIILVLIQVLLCNYINLFGIATPFIFIYFIFRLPVNMSTGWLLTLSFAIGLTVDIFSDTQGMNSLACTFIGAMRNPIFRLFVPRHNELTDHIPSTSSMGFGTYLKFLTTMTFLYCVIITSIEAFTISNMAISALRAVGSTILSFVIILGIDCIVNTKNEKRL